MTGRSVRSCQHWELVPNQAVSTHDLVQTLRSTETSRSHANDEDVNVTGKQQSACKLAMPIRGRRELRRRSQTHMSAPMVGDLGKSRCQRGGVEVTEDWKTSSCRCRDVPTMQGRGLAGGRREEWKRVGRNEQWEGSSQLRGELSNGQIGSGSQQEKESGVSMEGLKLFWVQGWEAHQ